MKLQRMIFLLAMIGGQLCSVPNDSEVKSRITQQPLINCQSEDNRLGTCMDIRDCDEYLTKLVTESQNTHFTELLRSSRKNCESRGFISGQAVCCPLTKNPPHFANNPITFPLEKDTVPNILNIPPLLHRPIPPVISSPNFLEKESFPGCGDAAQKIFLRIASYGEPARNKTWPWLVAIAYNTPGGLQFKCAGTLVTDKHILTSAQCVTPDMTVVKVGALNITSESEGLIIPIEKGLIYGGFDSKTLQNDIALIVLKERVKLSDSVKPICLPLTKKLQEKDITTYLPFTAGWKLSKRNKVVAVADQRQFQEEVISQSKCRELLPQKELNVDNNLICTERLFDQYYADIGGSLMYPERHGDNFLFYSLGILIYGEQSVPRNGAYVPGVYTRVSPYIEWIKNEIQNS